ncbi:MAG: diguanylate cyclase [Chromatiaceae bacterium]|nr:diguanylate cyclase [Chromatiaceae bacterium]MCF7993459.1 diguanylate cyclase [Chromatiaceae bacterium]MCF8015023.1 diguanylate cyclase [Chromatiaceae bacterium]
MADQRPRILAIDDTPANLLILGTALSEEFDLQIATSGPEGLALATQSPPDLILLDVMMPGMDGFETCERLKTMPTLREIPVVFVTALNEIDAESRGLRCGAADYILKPINVAITQQRIRNLLERDQLRREVAHQRDQLAARLQSLQRHDTWMIQRNQMIERLLACASREEAHQIIAQGAAELFAGHAGLLATPDKADSTQLKVVATWGDVQTVPERFAAEDCWAIRLNSVHEVSNHASSTQCQHFVQAPPSAYLGVSLMVRGETLGLLHISLANAIDAEQRRELRSLTLAVSESIKLALSNLQLQEELREAAIRDQLTGLFNRRYLDETLPRELHRCQREAKLLVAAMLDVDHFKRFNDHYGHDAGDEVLRGVGALLNRNLRADDLACRYGGEELTLILPNATAEEARGRLERIRCDIMALRVLYQDGELPPVTISIGIAASRVGELDAAALLARADAALYRAKASGRNRVVVAAEQQRASGRA